LFRHHKLGADQGGQEKKKKSFIKADREEALSV
jgi:hypothetical protein